MVRNRWRSSSSVNCSIAIMLTGPERSILLAQLGDRLLGGHLTGGGRRPVARRPRLGSGLDGRLGRGHVVDRPRRDPAPRRREWRATSGCDLPGRFHLRDFGANRRRGSALTVSRHCCARCVRSDSAVARCTSSFGGQRAQRIERAAGIADRLSSCRSADCLERQRRLVGAQHLLAQAFELRDVLVHQALAVDDRVEQALALLAHQRHVARAGLDAPLELARPRLRAAAPRRRPRRCARPAPACVARASAAVWLSAFGVVARVAERAAACRPARSRRRSFCSSSRAIDSRASACRASRPAISSRTRADLGRHQLGALLHARLVGRGALSLASAADDRLLLAVELGRSAPAIAAVACAIACSKPAVSPTSRSSASRLGVTFSRSSLISRLVARMPRDSVLLAAGDDMRAAEDVAVERSPPVRRRVGASARRRLERLGDQRLAHRPRAAPRGTAR